MVFPAHPLAPAYVVVEIFQLVLGVDVFGQDGLFQITEKITVNHRVVKIHIVPKTVFLRIIGQIPSVVKGEETQGQFLKGRKALLEAVWIVSQGLQVALIAAAELFLVGLVEGLSDHVP